MKQLDDLSAWYHGLQARERMLVAGTAVIVLVTLFYISTWEPLHTGLAEQQQQQFANQKSLAWMQQASAEAKALKAAGNRTRKSSGNQAITLVLEQTSKNSAIKNNLSKLESSGKDGARVTLDGASFDQMLIWLNTLQQNHGIVVSSASIDRADASGTVNARLSFSKNE